MSDEQQQALESIKQEAKATLNALKPTLQGVMHELKSHRRHNHDHEDFMINEFRRLTAAVDRLADTLAKLS